MAKINSVVNLDMSKQQILNACLQNLTVHPTNPSLAQIYYNTADKTVYCWTGDVGSGGSGWLDLGYLTGSYVAINEAFQNNEVLGSFTTDTSGNVTSIAKRLMTLADLGYTGSPIANNYVHPTGFTYDSGILTNFTVIERIQVNNEGHVTSVTTRNITITPALIGAAEANHTHTLATAATDVTATAAELNILDLSGVTGSSAGWVYRFISPTQASWGRLKGSEIDNDLLWCIINDVTASTSTTYSGSKIEALIAAVNANVGNLVSGALINQGGFTPTTSSSAPVPVSSGTIKNGYTWVFTGVTDFSWNGSSVDSGDMLIANQDNADPTIPSHFTIVNKNIPNIVDSTTVLKGIVRLATNSEAQTKTDATIALTPANLAALNATDTFTGLSRYATQNEVNNGVVASATITPATLKVFYDNYIAGYTALLGDGSSVSFDIVHNLNSYINVQVYEESTGDVVWCQIRRINSNTVRLMMNVAPTSNQYRVVINK